MQCKQNGWTDPDAVWELTHVDLRNNVLDEVEIAMGRAILGIVRPTEKHA